MKHYLTSIEFCTHLFKNHEIYRMNYKYFPIFQANIINILARIFERTNKRSKINSSRLTILYFHLIASRSLSLNTVYITSKFTFPLKALSMPNQGRLKRGNGYQSGFTFL